MQTCGCKLKIITESGGESALFCSDGVFERSEKGGKVRYEIEGDEAELVFSDTALENRRFGKCGLEVRFTEGEKTVMKLGTSPLIGEILVRTVFYRLYQDETEKRMELRYELFGAENIQTFSLKIQLFFSEEK